MSRQRWMKWCGAMGMALALVVLAGCGAASNGSTTTSAGPQQSGLPGRTTGGQTSFGPAATARTGQSNSAGPQYLIKTLAVSMRFSDTRAVASNLQIWIATTDPQSTSAGSSYEQVDSDSYRVTITFSISASVYPQVFSYLAGYAQTHHGHLENLQETVQDVSNDYVDTESRLKNLRAEQNRLLALMNQATNLNDTLTIEQKLTDVEGQIEQIEAHLAALNGQTTFYKVSITLDPEGGATTTPRSDASWNPGQTIHDAFTSALGFGQGLVSVLIWLAFFAVYLVPVVVIFLLVRRWLRARARRSQPAVISASAPYAAPGVPPTTPQPPAQPQP